MPALDRKLQKIFGSNSANSGQVGSARANTFVLSTDLDVLQQLAAWQDGLNAVTVSGDKLMPLEEQQAIEYVITSQLKYIFQRGIPEYLATETYFDNSLVIEPGTVKLYVSLVDDNTGNALSDVTKWALCIDLANIETLPLNNYSATVDPTINDDSGDGYSAGSIWYNSTGTGEAFLCVDASVGAADWIKTTLTVDELGSAAFMAASAFTSAAEGLAIMALFKGRPTKGLRLSNNVTDATNDINIQAGTAVSDDGTTIINGPAYTKQLNALFAAGDNQGFLSTGTIADTTYHIWAVCKDGGVDPDYIADVSATAPTMPGTYTKKCRIGSIIRKSGAILGFIQTGNRFVLKTPILDVNATFGASASNTTMSLPGGVKVLGLFTGWVNRSVANAGLKLNDPDAGTTLIPTNSAAPLGDILGPGNAGMSSDSGSYIECVCNTSSQVAIAAANASTTVRIVTCGWVDALGQQ